MTKALKGLKGASGGLRSLDPQLTRFNHDYSCLLLCQAELPRLKTLYLTCSLFFSFPSTGWQMSVIKSFSRIGLRMRTSLITNRNLFDMINTYTSNKYNSIAFWSQCLNSETNIECIYSAQKLKYLEIIYLSTAN